MAFAFVSANVNAAGTMLTVVTDSAAPPLYVDGSSPTALGLTLTADGSVVGLGVWSFGNSPTFYVALTQPVYTGQTLLLTYDPVGSGTNIFDQVPADPLTAFTDQPVTNNSTVDTQTGFWTTRTKVENRWGANNTRIWSNKGDHDTVAADPVAWQSALDDTDTKFNVAFLNRGYTVPPWDSAEMLTSNYALRFQTLAAIWAGTELYFARGWTDRGGLDQEERDRMQGWRKYVDDEMAAMFDAGLDIDISDTLTADDAGGFQFVPRVGSTDMTAAGDEFSNGF